MVKALENYFQLSQNILPYFPKNIYWSNKKFILIPFNKSYHSLDFLFKSICTLAKKELISSDKLQKLIKEKDVVIEEYDFYRNKLSKCSSLLTTFQDIQSFFELKREFESFKFFFFEMFKDSRGRNYSKCFSHPITNKISRAYIVPITFDKELIKIESSTYFNKLSSINILMQIDELSKFSNNTINLEQDVKEESED